ncbi:MAG: STAS domain-containing protein [Syntrophobacteraceae bacterium]
MITSVHKLGNRVILKFHEDIVDIRSGEDLKSTLMELYASGEKEVVLDFGSIHVINSHGIGKILMFYKRFREVGGSISVAPLDGSIKEIFETLMLDKLIPEVNVQ